MARRRRRTPPLASAPASDRDRTVFAGMEAVVGAALAVVGLLLLSTSALGRAAGAALIVLGVIAVAQSVAVGLGLMKVPEGRDDPSDRED